VLEAEQVKENSLQHSFYLNTSQDYNNIADNPETFNLIFELFCLQNSLIVGMQPQVCGKVGSLVGFWVDHGRHSR